MTTPLELAESEIVKAAAMIERQAIRIRELEEEAADEDRLREKMASILRRTANALKGPPRPLHSHDWSDLPEVAAALREALTGLVGSLSLNDDEGLIEHAEPMQRARAALGNNGAASPSVASEVTPSRPTNSALIEELASLAIHAHFWVDGDNWYSCPKAPDGCADDQWPKDVCNCGADTHNERVTALLARLRNEYSQFTSEKL